MDCCTLILGGGASGLAAAAHLAEQTDGVRVLEARERFGGRILTTWQENGFPCELGAEFLHGEAAETRRWLHEAGLSAYRADESQWLAAKGGPREDDGFWDKVAEPLENLDLARGQDPSLAQALTDLDPKRRELVAHFVEGFHAASLEAISARSMEKEGAVLKDDAQSAAWRVEQGYGRLIDHLVRVCAARGCVLTSNSPVDEVRWRRGRVEARVRGETITAERAIVTVPLSLLQANAVRFDPPLTAKTPAFQKLAMGSVVRVLLRFAEPFWEPGLGFFHALKEPFPVGWTAAPRAEPWLVSWGGGAQTQRLRGLGEAQRRWAAVRSLAKVFDRPERWIDSRLTAVLFHDWDRDPWARGAYSFARPGGAEAARILAEPLDDTLYFAGEATHTEGQSGTVEGALATGQRVAQQIILRHHSTTRMHYPSAAPSR